MAPSQKKKVAFKKKIDHKIHTGRFSGGTKKSIATKQLKTQHRITTNATLRNATLQIAKQGKGGAGVVDLSHKNSAGLNSLISEKVASNPKNIDQPFIQSLDTAFNQSGLSKKDRQTVSHGFDSLEKYSGYKKGPMSPRSEKRVHETMKLYSNKNEDNLRYEPASENRAISEYPHYTINSGSMSPRSRKQNEFAVKFHSNFKNDLDDDERRLTKSYANVSQAIQKGSLKSTQDMVQYRKKSSGK